MQSNGWGAKKANRKPFSHPYNCKSCIHRPHYEAFSSYVKFPFRGWQKCAVIKSVIISSLLRRRFISKMVQQTRQFPNWYSKLKFPFQNWKTKSGFRFLNILFSISIHSEAEHKTGLVLYLSENVTDVKLFKKVSLPTIFLCRNVWFFTCGGHLQNFFLTLN